jgi:hypothetical protein
MLSTTVNGAKSAQNCPKLPKDKSSKLNPKSRLQCFTKQKNSTYTRGTRACFHRENLQSRNFSHAIFIVRKRPSYVNSSKPPCGNWWFSQGPTPCAGMRFCGHVTNSAMNKNPKKLISCLYKKVVYFYPYKLLCPRWQGKNKLSLQIQMLWSRKWQGMRV